jgi:hypothetical protein
MILSPRSVTLFALLCAPVVAQQRIEHSTDVYPGGDTYPDWIVSRVVDDLTGAPIAGADVYLVKEAETPIAGEFWYTRKVQTDRDGWLRAPVGDIDGEWHMQVLRHPRYGVAARHGRGGAIWRVGRPFDVPVRIVDWRGAPVAGARIGFCGGCGHTPDLANATTAADGVAVLSQIDPHSDIGDVYVQHAGLGLGYDSVRWNPGEGPEVVRCRWAPAMTGTVVDHLGQPIGGAFVAALDVHRGPWARTAADGTFTLLGGPPELGPSHVRFANGRKVWFDEATRFPVTLRVPDPNGGEPTQGVMVQPDGAASAPATRNLRVRLTGDDSLLATADWPGAPKRRSSDDEVLEVPATGPFVISVYATEGARGRPFRRDHFFADASQLPPEPVELAWFAPLEVVGRVVDARGLPVASRVFVRENWSVSELPDFEPGHAQPGFRIATHVTGRTLLEVVPADRALRPRLMWIVLPERGTAPRLDLGDVVVHERAQLRVLAADGRALAGREVSWARAGCQEVAHMRKFALDEDGGWLGPDLLAGDALVVRASDDAVPFRTVLAGVGPWTITAPDGRLELDVVDDQGAPCKVTCVVGDHDRLVRPGKPLLGLPRGRSTLYLSAEGFRTAIVDAVVGDATVRVRVALQKR